MNRSRSILRVILLCSFTASVPLVSPPARAQTASETLDERTRRRTYEQAHDAFTAKDWATAHRLFSELWASRPTYDIAAFLGQTELQLRRYRDAAEHIAYSLAHWPPREDLALHERVTKGLARAKQEIGTLTIQVQPENARVLVDGRAWSKESGPEAFLEPGPRSVVVELEGHRSQSHRVELGRGEQQELEVVLEPISQSLGAPAASAPTDTSPVATRPPEAVSIDPRASTSTNGGHPKPAWLVTGGTLFAVTLGAGFGFAVAANSAQDDVDRLRRAVGSGGCAGTSSQQCSELRDAAESKDRNTNLSRASFVLAGATAAVTLGYWLWPRSKDGSARLDVVWTPRGGAFATIGGTL